MKAAQLKKRNLSKKPSFFRSAVANTMQVYPPLASRKVPALSNLGRNCLSLYKAPTTLSLAHEHLVLVHAIVPFDADIGPLAWLMMCYGVRVDDISALRGTLSAQLSAARPHAMKF